MRRPSDALGASDKPRNAGRARAERLQDSIGHVCDLLDFLARILTANADFGSPRPDDGGGCAEVLTVCIVDWLMKKISTLEIGFLQREGFTRRHHGRDHR